MAPQHFLVVAYSAQGHINPARALARRLARATGARVTLSTAVSTHRAMFPTLAVPDEEVVGDAGDVSYAPYSDGYDRGFSMLAGSGDDACRYWEAFDRVGRETFSVLLDRLATRGRPVTRVVYSLLMWWAADVAREHGIPSALYWIQPAKMLAIYYRYFHGYEKLIAEKAGEPEFAVEMPGLPPVAIRDLPSFFTDTTDGNIVGVFNEVRRTFQQLDAGCADGAKPMVLVNTVEALEVGALASVPEVDMFPVGPAVVSLITDGATAVAVGDVYKHDEKAYMEWLDEKAARSVVYVSFGSVSFVSERQKEAIRRGLDATGRPYLWVVREDNRDDGMSAVHGDDGEMAPQEGMVVRWCNQVQVLSHPAVGCFVTHCGWNSTLESVACGAPVVAVPQWSDQDTNASLVVEWSTGVRAETSADRFLEGKELASCIDMVMGDTEKGVSVRGSSVAWKTKVQEAIAEGGSSDRNLRAFLAKFSDDAEEVRCLEA